MNWIAAFVVIAALFLPGLANAEVADSSNAGFTIKQSFTIQAAPRDVYRKLVRNIGEWWDPTHTFSGDARNLSIDEKPMGCFCEKLPDGGSVRHLEVVYLAPGKTLTMIGALGPMQPLAATGSLSIQLSEAEGGATTLKLTYAVTGYSAAGMNTWAAPVDRVLQEQFVRLKNYVEQGSPALKQ